MPETPHLSIHCLHKQFVLHLLDGKKLTGFTYISFDVPHTRFVGIAGRSGSGKSSLLNRLLKEERVLVSEMPGTTRDAIDAVMTWHRRRFRIVDTAGMRRPGRVRGGGQVEFVSVAGAKKAIFDADVVALMIDANEGATDQDAFNHALPFEIHLSVAISRRISRSSFGFIVVSSWPRKLTEPSVGLSSCRTQ